MLRRTQAAQLRFAADADLAFARPAQLKPGTLGGRTVDFVAGQRWDYRTRDQDAGSSLTILRVEDLPRAGRVAFVAIDGLRVTDERAVGGVRTEIRFTEFAVDALASSVTALRATVVPPEHQSLYDGWRRAFDAGDAHVFERSVADAVARFQNLCDSSRARRVSEGDDNRCSWWLMDSLPDLIWARLIIRRDGRAEVFDSDGRTHHFATEEEGRFFLLEDEFRLWALYEAEDFIQTPFSIEDVHPPKGSTDAELLPQMVVRRR